MITQTSLVERAARQIKRWRADPRIFVREELKVDRIDWWQEDGLLAFNDNQRIAMQACKGPGKTAWLAWVILLFLTTRPFPKIPCTAITKENLRDNLWPEISKWQGRSEFLLKALEWTKERVTNREHPNNWFAVARAWSRDADPEQQANTLAGLHADYLMFVLDEAGGIPDSVAAAAEAGLSVGIELKLLLTGNPTHLEGPLWRASTTERDLYHFIHVTGDPDNPRRASRVNKDWARQQIRKYGRNSAFVQVNVFGNFPQAGTDAIIPMYQFLDAEQRDPAGLRTGYKILGVDVARFGNDQSAAMLRDGMYVEKLFDWSYCRVTETHRRVKEIALAEDVSEIRVDDIGVGGGLTDLLYEDEDLKHVLVVGVNVGTTDNVDTEMQVNLRAEIALHLQNLFAEGLIGIHPQLGQETLLRTECTTLKMEMASSSNKRKVEDKRQYRKRTGRSPNQYDALALAFSDLAVGISAGASLPESELRRGELNPYEDKPAPLLIPEERERLWRRA